MACMSFAETMPPVGFCGEFRMRSFVLGVILASSSAGSKLKLRDSRR